MHFIPICTVALLLGICGVFWYLPSSTAVICGLVVISLGILIFARKYKAMLAIALAILGFCYMSYHVLLHKSRILPPHLESTPIQVVGTIISVVEETQLHSLRLVFAIKSPSSLARRVRLTWYNPKLRPEPGDTWQLTVKLKRPHASVNPAGLDLEKFYFQERSAAVGTVVTKNVDSVLLSKSWNIDRWRQHLFQRICGEKSEFSGMVAALLLGTKHGINDAQMSVLHHTGTMHLMVIAGLHIGFVATVAMFAVRVIWYLLPVVPSTWILPHISAGIALCACVIYALLAGFGIATQRALIMLSLFLIAMLLQRQIAKSQIFCLALLGVLLWDPFVVLSIGFWLSFWAVACLLYAFIGRSQLARPWCWLYPQLAIGLGLLPLSLLFFQQNSIVAPLANLIAIPWVGFAVVPFCLAGCFRVAEYNISLLWPILEYLHKFPIYNWTVPSTYLYLRLACAVFGFVWLFAPRGVPGRYWAVLAFVPLLIGQAPLIPYRQAEFTLLDVGQGLAAVVRTASHTLVYDTGTPGQGQMAIAPYLRTLGARQIDTLVISHADNDHMGGVTDLLAQISATQILTSDPEKLSGSALCRSGQEWDWDGVKFRMLHPNALMPARKRNDHSCVLLVQAGDQRVLLTGDIENRSEEQLIAAYGADLQADILVVPHHGSRTSSSENFIDRVNPVLALIPVGYRNRYGHPKPQIIARYMQRDIPIYASDIDGAISLRLGLPANDPGYLRPRCQRSGMPHPFWRVE